MEGLRVKVHDCYLPFCRVCTLTIPVNIKECAVRLIVLCITHATNSAHAAYFWPLGITHATSYCVDGSLSLLLLLAEKTKGAVQRMLSVHIRWKHESHIQRLDRPVSVCYQHNRFAKVDHWWCVCVWNKNVLWMFFSDWQFRLTSSCSRGVSTATWPTVQSADTGQRTWESCL